MKGKNSDKRPYVKFADGSTVKFDHASRGQSMVIIDVSFCHNCGRRLVDKGEVCPRCGNKEN